MMDLCLHRAHSCLNGGSCLLQNQSTCKTGRNLITNGEVRGERREGEQGEEEGEKAQRERGREMMERRIAGGEGRKGESRDGRRKETLSRPID